MLLNVNVSYYKNLITIPDYFDYPDFYKQQEDVIFLKSSFELEKWKLDKQKILIIMGSEHKGINKIIKRHCDIIFKIKINTEIVESLNVSCASSIAFYEVSKNI